MNNEQQPSEWPPGGRGLPTPQPTPKGQFAVPPAGKLPITSPGQFPATPPGQFPAPPPGQFPAPPAGHFSVPPAGNSPIPPAGQFPVPSAVQGPVPPSRQFPVLQGHQNPQQISQNPSLQIQYGTKPYPGAHLTRSTESHVNRDSYNRNTVIDQGNQINGNVGAQPIFPRDYADNHVGGAGSQLNGSTTSVPDGFFNNRNSPQKSQPHQSPPNKTTNFPINPPAGWQNPQQSLKPGP